MSLQVWLPLNGHIENCGVSNLNFTLTNLTVDSDNAKFGKCYYSSTFSTCQLVSDKTISLGNKQSMFCWVKFTGLTSDSSLGGAMCGQHRYPNCTGMGLTLKYVSSTTGYLSINTGTGSSRTYNTYCGGTLLSANIWYHVGFVYDGNVVKLYVNGNLDGTHTVGALSNPADYVQVFTWSFSSSSGNDIYANYHLKGYLNDVRIYDHCLSLKEIKNISKGLLAHYVLNSNYADYTTYEEENEDGAFVSLIRDREFDCSGFKNTLRLSGNIYQGLDGDDSTLFYKGYNFSHTGYLYKSNFNAKLYSYTINLWVKIPATMSTSQHFMYGTFDSWTSNGIGCWRDNSLMYYSWIMRSSAESSYGSVSNIEYTADEWTMVTWTWDGTTITAYKNATVIGTNTYGSGGYCYCPNIYLGNSLFGDRTSENDECTMYDFRLYATCLQVDDIKELYKKSTCITDNGNLITKGEFIESDYI